MFRGFSSQGADDQTVSHLFLPNRFPPNDPLKKASATAAALQKPYQVRWNYILEYGLWSKSFGKEVLGGELPTNRGCGLVHPSDLHGIFAG